MNNKRYLEAKTDAEAVAETYEQWTIDIGNGMEMNLRTDREALDKHDRDSTLEMHEYAKKHSTATQVLIAANKAGR